jgi:O-antigen ligase
MWFSQTSFYKDFIQLSFYRKLYLFGLFILAIGLPLSSVLVSISQFILMGTWLVERDFKAKFLKIRNNKILWAFFLLPLLHLIWLINTTDFIYALHDLKIKVPLVIFPLVLGTINPLSQKELKWILYTFIFSVFCGTSVSFAILTGIYPIEYTDIRAISLFISHIRFGLMILLALFVTAYYMGRNFKELPLWKKLASPTLILWFFTFLIILQSITSWIALILVLLLTYFRNYRQIKSKLIRIIIAGILSLIILGSVGIISKVYFDFYHTKTINLNTLPHKTPRGNKYLNDTKSDLKENGHYINILICYKELAKTWPTLSKIPFNGSNVNGYPIQSTMIRYLASKGLPKDTDGLLSLDKIDIALIEDGYASCVYRKKFIPYVKAYNVLWEIDRYIKSGDANNKSIVQRIEFGKAAIHIIRENFWFGVGTGDLKVAYQKSYKELDTNLHKSNQLRAHNQFLTFFVTFGILGFILAIFSMLYPGYKMAPYKGITLVVFLLMIFISMLNEDTLETQAGVTFYIAFYTLLVFSNPRKI